MNIKHIILFSCFTIFLQVTGNSQVDWNEKTSNLAFPTRVILPLAYSFSPQGTPFTDVVISFGYFDNYQVSSDNGFAETDIAVNPRNPNNFVGSDNRVTGYVGTPWIYYTTNGGVSWGQSSISGNQGDPVFTADSLGNFYLAVLNSGVQIWKSNNGGVSWSFLTTAVSNSYADKEWIAADQTMGPYQNHVYIAYVNFATGASVDFHRSVNNGASWSFVGNMGSGTPNPGPNIAVGPNGNVYLAWYNSGGTSVRISVNGGASFGSAITASAHSTPGAINSSGRYCLKGDIRVNGMPQLACDMTNGPYRGFIYDAYATNPPGPDAADIYMTRSTDNGATWNVFSPVKVNDDATYNDQWMTDVSIDNQGRVWVYWWDSRNDASNVLTETYGAVSTNGGVSFLPNFKISNQNFNPHSVKIYQGSNHYYLGDYQGMSGKTMTFPFYTGQNNTLHDFTAYLPDYGISFSKTIDSVNQGSTSVVRVRGPLMGTYSGTVTYNATVSPSPSPGTINFTWSPSNVKTYYGNPDSITLNSQVSSNVPYNLYTITVTGTESGGPRTHTRTFQIRVGNFVGISGNNGETPMNFSLSQNYPNPFNPSTMIDFSLPKQSLVSLKVYDAIGREVAVLLSNVITNPGFHSFKFNADGLTSGVYYYKLTTPEFSDIKKMVLVK